MVATLGIQDMPLQQARKHKCKYVGNQAEFLCLTNSQVFVAPKVAGLRLTLTSSRAASPKRTHV
eukprot:5817881-Pleurochrysis_carterae.AAC.1